MNSGLISTNIEVKYQSNAVFACDWRKIHFIAIKFENPDSRRLYINLSSKVSVCGTTLFCFFFNEIFRSTHWNVNKYFDDFYLSEFSSEFFHPDKFNIDPTHQKFTFSWWYCKGQVGEQDGFYNCFQIINFSPIVRLPSFIRN